MSLGIRSRDKGFFGFDWIPLYYSPFFHDTGLINSAIATKVNGIYNRKRQVSRFFELCVGLYELKVPDLQLYMIFDEMYEDNELSDYKKWLITRVVKRQDTSIGPNVKLCKRINLKYKRGFMEELFRRYFGGVDGGSKKNDGNDRINGMLLIKN